MGIEIIGEILDPSSDFYYPANVNRRDRSTQLNEDCLALVAQIGIEHDEIRELLSRIYKLHEEMQLICHDNIGIGDTLNNLVGLIHDHMNMPEYSIESLICPAFDNLFGFERTNLQIKIAALFKARAEMKRASMINHAIKDSLLIAMNVISQAQNVGISQEDVVNIEKQLISGYVANINNITIDAANAELDKHDISRKAWTVEDRSIN